jgi:hypothetical protein
MKPARRALEGLSRSAYTRFHTLPDFPVMRNLRLCALWLLLSLLSPLVWSHALHAAATPSRDAARVVMPCHAQVAVQVQMQVDMATGTPTAKHKMVKHQAKAGCGDCSACHVLALLQAEWQLHGPTLVEATPGWHATPGCGRLKGCELYRPPQA